MELLPSRPGDIEFGGGVFSLSYKSIPFLSAKGVLFAPRFDGETVAVPAKTERGAGKLSYSFNRGAVKKLDVFWLRRNRYFEIFSSALMARDAVLTEWGAFGNGGSFCGVDQIVVANPNVKGRMTAGVFDKMRLRDQFAEISHTMGLGVPSWFFPLPVNYIFAAYRELLFLALDGVHDFSQWSFSRTGPLINKWRLEYGNHIRCKRGQVLKSPRWIGFFMDSDDPFEPWPVYAEILRGKGKIRASRGERPRWWSDLNYVTWGDQHVYADGKKTENYQATEMNLSEETLRRWIGIIEKHRLPSKTITIDGYWCDFIGNWKGDPKRFPDMRSLVDELHRRGYRVIFWYCPYEAERKAPVFAEHPEYFVEETIAQELFLEKGMAVKVNPRYDWTNPELRRFIRRDIRRMLSPEKGCYNADGLKLDFYGSAPNAKRVAAFHDPSWGIGHRFVHKSHALIYRWAKQYKPDCRIDGENGNPFFADYTDSLRAWDWCESDYTPYNDRVKLASVICPGVPALYDEHIHFKNLYKYSIRSAVARPIFFNVEHFHGDMHKLGSREFRDLAAILQEVQSLNARARDVRPEDVDNGEIYDWNGRLIGKVAKDDTSLVVRNGRRFNVILLNDSGKTLSKGLVIDPFEFGVKGRPICLRRRIAPGRVEKIENIGMGTPVPFKRK